MGALWYNGTVSNRANTMEDFMNTEQTLWYTRAAQDFDHALPVGNGRIGGMVFGGAQKETIKLNEDSI